MTVTVRPARENSSPSEHCGDLSKDSSPEQVRVHAEYSCQRGSYLENSWSASASFRVRDMACLFLSHSSLNNDKAIVMRNWLAQNGWDDVFLDLDPHTGLAPGEYWRQALAAAADRCQAVLCLISPEWKASNWCFSEFLLAKQYGKRVFPIIVGDIDLSELSSEITANHQAVDLVRDPQGWDRLKEGLKRAGLDPETFPFPPGRRPYPGFEPLTEEDAAIFFGREAQIVRGLDRLRTMSEVGVERMLVILGASGAGKSSYLRAGLWPRLKRDDRNFVLLPVIRPERAALTGKFGLLVTLESAIAETRAQSEAMRNLPRSRGAIGQFIVAKPDGLARLFAGLRAARVAALVNHVGRMPTVVIPIDQGEELFNEEGRQEAGRLMDLLAVTSAQDRAVVVILAMRSDSFPPLQNEPRLASVGKVPFDLPPLPVGSIRLVIEGPARIATPPVKLDPDLVEVLLEDSTGQDTLPLLAFTLGRLLQDYGAEGKLTLAQYDRLGRINGAVNAAVSEVLARGTRLGTLPGDKATLDALLREMFIPHLARVNEAGQFIRRMASNAELPARFYPLIELFVEARLLLRDRRPGHDGDTDIIEVAHEALLREWPALRSWLEADRDFLVGKDKLAEDIANWRAADGKHKDEMLLSGLNLTRARQWLLERKAQDLSDEERKFIAASVARAEATTRRRRRLSIAAVFVLLSIAGTAIWEWIEAEHGRYEAAAARAVAENRLNLARRSAENLVKLIASDLRSVQGIQIKTLEQLLQTAKASFDELSSAVGDDPGFLQYRAKMMSEFGDTYFKAKGLEQAGKAFEEALEIYRALAARDSNAVAWQRGIADQIEKIGLVRQQQGKIETAMDNFRQSLDIRRGIAGREPGNAISYRDLAWSYYNIGEILMQRRKASESLASHNEALANLQRALSIDPADLELDYKRSLIHVSIGVAYEAMGNREQRLESYQEALAIRQRLVDANPDNAEWKRALSWAYFWVGGFYLDDGKLEEALKNIKLCMSLRLALVKDNPGDLVAKYDLAWAYHVLGTVLQEKGDLAAAGANFDQAYKLRQQLVDIDEKNTRWRKDLALSNETLGDLARAQNDPASAIRQYRSAIAILEELVSAAPTNGGWRDSLAVIYNKLGGIQKCQGDIDGAVLSYEAALIVRSKLLQENPDDPGTMLRVARSENLVGEALQLRGETENARNHYRHSAELARRMLGRDPKNTAARNLLETVEKKIAVPLDPASSDNLRACPST
jgi:tetratricopeptide (TPR) repeat protein